MIVIIDYGMGNLRSVINKLKNQAIISSKVKDIENATKLILPGVGHFANGMKKLKELELIEVLNQKVINEKTPILGICLGMQLFTEFSEEGNVNGLNWISGKTKKFSFDKDSKLKIPHMGWNNLEIKKQSKLAIDIDQEDSFYFVHSYFVDCQEQIDILGTTDYGITFTSAIEKDNIYGTQFHPEKSHDSGRKILKNFMEI